MKILWKYVIKELIGPFLFGLAIITFVLLMDYILDILDKIITKGLSAPVVLEIFVLSLAWMLALSLPMAFLIAALMGYGRLSADSEVIACKSCGISLVNIVMPGLAMGLVLALFLVWFNDRILPEANHRARLLMSDVTRKKPTWNLEPNVFLDYFPGYHILVKKIDNNTSDISDVTIIDQKDPQAPRTITAKSGNIKFTRDGSLLVMHLYDGEIHEPDPQNINRYRVRGKMYLDRYKVTNSADFGVTFFALLGEKTDIPAHVHPQLHNQALRSISQLEQRERQPDLVVEVARIF